MPRSPAQAGGQGNGHGSGGRRGSVAGRVTGPDGAPVEEARVLVETGPSHPDLAALTGPDGRFRLEGLAAGLYGLRILAGQLAPATARVTVAAGRRAEVEVRLAPPGRDAPDPWDSDDVAPELPGWD